MSAQDKDSEKQEHRPMTGAHIAPKSHGAACPCCMPEDDEGEE